MVLLDSRYSR